MPHNLPLITTLATALSLSLIMGFIAVKLKLPSLVGYLLAGVMLGPFTPGFIVNSEITAELAEMGVMLLMFGVGLHFSVEDLLETRKIALPGALLQIVAATFLGALLAIFWGWSIYSALVFGLALSVASTVVLIRSLESRSLLGSINGQIAVGWLVVEDLAMVLVLVFLPLIAEWVGGSHTPGEAQDWGALLALTIFKILSFIVVMFVIGRLVFPKILWHIARTGSRELFTLCIIVAAVSIAFAASKLFGISFALGAFFAGMIIRESKFSRRAAEESLPFRDAFAVLFFVSVGMLFNPFIFVEDPFRILAVVSIIVLGKSLVAAILVLALRYPLTTALTVSASLAQIGEFSFILAGLGVRLGLLPLEGQELIIAGSLISIAINPLIFKAIEPLQAWVRSHYSWVKDFERTEDPLGKLPPSKAKKYLLEHIVVVGYGKVGKYITKKLVEKAISYVVIEQNREIVAQLRQHKTLAVYGPASEPSILLQARIEYAAILVISTPDIFNIRPIVNIARKLNPKIKIAIRARNKDEVFLLQQEIKGIFFFDEEELAKNMTHYILTRAMEKNTHR